MSNYPLHYPPVLAIDPGSKESGYVCWSLSEGLVTPDDEKSMHPQWARTEAFGKVSNEKLLTIIGQSKYDIVIEKITLYQRADQNIHDTIWWYGRFSEAAERRPGVHGLRFMTRNEVKRQLLPELMRKRDGGKAKITDSTITAYLKNRFAPGVSNHGKGTKAHPGYFYGFHRDVWQAFALAVACHDSLKVMEEAA